MKKCAAVLACVAGLAGGANAALITSETFTYPDGNLIGNGTWLAHSGAGSTPVQVVGGKAVLAQGGGSREDVNLPFPALGAGTTIFASFDVSNTGGVTDVFFAHFMQNTSVFRSRIWVTAPGFGGDYRIGFGDGTTIAQTWGSDLSFGTTYKAIVSYNFDTGQTRLWINPIDETSTNLSVAGAAGTPVVGFALRQAGGNSVQTIDNLLIGSSFGAVIPTPGALALLGLGGLVAARRRR